MALRGIKETTTALILKYLPNYPPADEQSAAPSARVQAAFDAALSELDEEDDLMLTQRAGASQSPHSTPVGRVQNSSQNSSNHTSPLSQHSPVSPIRGRSELPDDIFERTAAEVRAAYGSQRPLNQNNAHPASSATSPPRPAYNMPASPPAQRYAVNAMGASTPSSQGSPVRHNLSPTTASPGYSPSSSQPASPTRAIGAAPGRTFDTAHSIDDSVRIARRERAGNSYVPKQETGNWAILVALLRYAHEENSMSDDILKAHAERHSRAPMFQTGDQLYTAFSGIKRLVECGYLHHFTRPSRYALTKTGRKLAERLWGEYNGTIERNPDNPNSDDEETVPAAHSPLLARIAHPSDRNYPTPIISASNSPTRSPSSSPTRNTRIERIPLPHEDVHDLEQQYLPATQPTYRSAAPPPSRPNYAPSPSQTIPSNGSSLSSSSESHASTMSMARGLSHIVPPVPNAYAAAAAGVSASAASAAQTQIPSTANTAAPSPEAAPVKRGRGRPKKVAPVLASEDESKPLTQDALSQSLPPPIARSKTALLPTTSAPSTPKKSLSAPDTSKKPRSPQAAAAHAAINRASATTKEDPGAHDSLLDPVSPVFTQTATQTAAQAAAADMAARAATAAAKAAEIAAAAAAYAKKIGATTSPKKAASTPNHVAPSASPSSSSAVSTASLRTGATPLTPIRIFPSLGPTVIDLDEVIIPDDTPPRQTAVRASPSTNSPLPSEVAMAVSPNDDLAFGKAKTLVPSPTRKLTHRMEAILASDLDEDVLLPPSAKRPKTAEVDDITLGEAIETATTNNGTPKKAGRPKKTAAPEPELKGWRTERYVPPDPDSLTHIVRDPEVDRPLQSSKPRVPIPQRISDLPLVMFSQDYTEIPGMTEHVIEKIIVYVDEREKRRLDLSFDYIQTALLDLGFEVRTCSLNLCDYIWLGVDPEGTHFVLDYGVERKRMGDLALSLIDNRYFEQKWRMRHTGITNLFYFVEEPLDIRTKGFEVEASDMFAAIAATAHGDRFKVFRVRDAMDTVRCLAEISNQLHNRYLNTKVTSILDMELLELIKVTHHSTTNYEKFVGCLTDHSQIHWTFDQFQERFKKRRQLEGTDLFAYQLMSMLDMSPRKAAAIVLKYKSMHGLIKAYKEASTKGERISMISTLEAGGSRVGVDVATFLLDTIAPGLQ